MACVDHEPVDLTLLVLDATEDARAAGPGHRWLLDLPEEPVTVTGDAHRLHQAIGNLLTNARTHTPDGTEVTVRLRAEHTAARLTVTDDGPGIPEELQPEVFGRFVRADHSRSRGTGSTGLGLSIVHAVVTAHGGTIEVDSRPGHILRDDTPPLTAGTVGAEEVGSGPGSLRRLPPRSPLFLSRAREGFRGRAGQGFRRRARERRAGPGADRATGPYRV